MLGTKTIVISIPKHLGPGESVMVPTTTSPSATDFGLASKQLTSLLSGNYIEIKDEPNDKFFEDVNKPSRKRQRLDHLSMEEKVMRRKLKNRVAAQTARDRKRVRMDQLEEQVEAMANHISELTELTTILTEQNSTLEADNAALREKLARCECGKERNTPKDEPQATEELEGFVIPVNAPTVSGSAASLPQQRAVGALAVLRIMALSTLCSQWIATASLGLLMQGATHQFLENRLVSPVKQPSHTLPVKKRPACTKWWGPHQQSWNPTGMS